jgi:hypothetical protein
MQQAVIVHREKISRANEMKYFQIPLQGTEKKVIGIETGIFLLTQLPAPVMPPDPGGSGTNAPCPNPGNAVMTEIDNSIQGADPYRQQIFQIGPAVNPSFKYSVAVYSVTVSVTAVDGDTPVTIATKLSDAINRTTLAEWNQNGGSGNNFKPFSSSGFEQILIACDPQHQIAAWGTGSCTGAPPPPPVPAYDPLFRVNNNDKAGVLSLQSPDRTDIFCQCEVYRQDKNISFADFTSKNFSEIEQWTFGKKRIATDVSITTSSPIVEAYYKDALGTLYNTDIAYWLNIYLWLEKR